MLDSAVYEEINDRAHAYARAFLERNLCPPEIFFDPDVAAAASEQILSPTVSAIIALASLLDVPVIPVDVLPKPGHASWLFPDNNGGWYIGVKFGQLEEWAATATPFLPQVVRTVLHEIGHRYINLPQSSTPAQRFYDSTPVQEQVSWTFAVAFLALLLGEYAHSRRNGSLSRDDSSRPFL